MKNQDLPTKDAQPNINITPLIDILLVLLIIFMVVSPLKPSRFQAAIPSEPTIERDILPHPHTLIVTIGTDLQIGLNQNKNLGSVDDTGKIAVELANVFRARRENLVFNENLAARGDLSDDEKTVKNVFIKAPRSVSYGDVIKVIDAVKGAGATLIGLQIDDLD